MLRQKTKKWLTRLGAGMLLGLSIFNLGSSFGQNNPTIPKGAGNFRRKEEVDVNPELKGMMKTAEQEAKLVLSQHGKVFVNSERENLGSGQTLLRYGVVSLWVLSAGVIFASLIFNFPFALGRAVLSALPGTVHTAVLKLTADKDNFLPGERMELTLALESGEEVSYAKAFIQYPQGVFFLDGIETEHSYQVSFQPEGLEVFFGDLKNKEFFFQEPLARIYFVSANPLDSQMTSFPEIKLSWEKSLVLSAKNKKEKGRNVLGKTVSPRFSLIFDEKRQLFCQRVTGDPEGETFWQEWLVSSPVAKENDKWNQLSENWSLGCVLGENKAGLVLVGNQKIDGVFLEEKAGQKKQKAISRQWQKGETFFHLIDLEKTEMENGTQGWKIFLTGAGVDFSWPDDGMAKVSLIENKK